MRDSHCSTCTRSASGSNWTLAAFELILVHAPRWMVTAVYEAAYRLESAKLAADPFGNSCDVGSQKPTR